MHVKKQFLSSNNKSARKRKLFFFQPYGDVGDGHAAASCRTFPDALSAYSLEGGTLFDFVSQ